MHNGNLAIPPGVLILLSGLPGSGKTTFAHALSQQISVEHIESDAIRRALAPNPTYSPTESGAVFAHVEELARVALESGRHALVDATNLTNRDRRRFLKLANHLGARVVAIRVTAPDSVIRERLRNPRAGFSQAGLDTFERMKDRPQPFALPSIVIDSRYSLRPAIDLICRLVTDRDL